MVRALSPTVPLLEVADVAVRFGGVVALAGVSFTVGHGEVRGLIGPNGSGKTTLFNVISGFYRASSGTVRLEGRPVAGVPRHGMAALGIGRTFQNLALFQSMTVRDNILAGAHHMGRSGFVAGALRLPAVRREERAVEERLDRLLDLLDLRALAEVPVAGLPFGTRKRVELARALVGGPRLLLLDEPACGLNHAEVDALGGLLRDIRRAFDLSILLVEHHMGLVMRTSDRVVALEGGKVIADGTPEAVRAAPEVIRAYLGAPATEARVAA